MARQQSGRPEGTQSQGEQSQGSAQQGSEGTGGAGRMAAGAAAGGAASGGTTGGTTGGGRSTRASESRAGQAGGAQPGATQPGGTQAGGTQAGGTQAGGAQAERERPVPTTREGAPGAGRAGTGMQRAGGVMGGTLARQQPDLMTTLMLSDPLAVANQMMANPFTFMRRFSEDMDRLFADFGIGSTGVWGPAYGGATMLGGREGEQQRSQALRGRQQRGAVGTGTTPMRTSTWAPQIELFQRGNEIVVRADLPGMNREDVNVDLEDGMLVISGERREPQEERGEGFYHTERNYGSFQRAIPLPEGVDEDRVNAQFRDGVLEVVIAVPEENQPRGRRVEIQ